MKLVIPGRVPSKKNSRRAIYVGGRTIMIASKQYEAWHEEAAWALKLSRVGRLAPETIVITFYPPDRIAGDLSNKCESVMDLLVDMEILKDDNWFICGDIHLKFGGVD